MGIGVSHDTRTPQDKTTEMPVATVARPLPARPLARITPYEAEKKARDRHPRLAVQARSGPEGPRADGLVAASKARDVTLLRKFIRLLQTSRGALLACRFLATVRVVHGLFAWRHRAMKRLYALGLLGFLQTRSAFAAAAGTKDKQAVRVGASNTQIARSASGAYDDEMEAFLSNAETLLFGASVPFARSATLPPFPHRFSLGNSSEDDHSQREPSLRGTQRASSSLPLLHASL